MQAFKSEVFGEVSVCSSLSLCFAHILGNTHPNMSRLSVPLLAACTCHFQLQMIFLMRENMKLYRKYTIL